MLGFEAKELGFGAKELGFGAKEFGIWSHKLGFGALLLSLSASLGLKPWVWFCDPSQIKVLVVLVTYQNIIYFLFEIILTHLKFHLMLKTKSI